MARAMKDSGIEWIGEIPADWSREKIFRIFQIIGSGTTPKSGNSDYYDGNIHWIQSGDINGETLRGTKVSITDTAIAQFSALKIYDAPFLIIAMYGASIGNISISNINACVNQACCVMKNGRQDIRYSFYVLKIAKNYLVWKAIGGGQPNISQDTIKQLWLPMPPYPEQHRISSFLDTQCARIDSIIEQTRASIEEYKKLKQAVITQAVTKGIRPGRKLKSSGIEWIGEIAVDYQLVKLKHVLRQQLQYGANQAGIPYDNTLPRYIRITDITTNGNLKETDVLSLSEADAADYILKNNDILFARSGATVGKSFIYKEEFGRSAFAGYLIKASINEKLLPDLLFFHTQSSIYEEWKNQIFIQATIQNIGADRYKEMPVILQPIKEQYNIVQYLNEKCNKIDSLIERKKDLLAELESYKKSIIFEYVTGKKEVP